MQENIFLTMKNTESCTLIESVPCDENKSTTGPTKRVTKWT